MEQFIFTFNMFAVCRGELGTLGAIQNLMTKKKIPSDDQVPLLFSMSDEITIRDLERMDSQEVYLIVDSLCNGFLDSKAVVEEMTVK